ncbi:MAG: AI-2E family transporter [Deltaproteobacteria bacterium]|nr:AI-2E family transporter [Deltaproteobacteria bacterium]
MDEEPRSLRIEIAPRTLLAIVAVVAGCYLFWQLTNVVLVIIVALVLVGTFDPLVGWLEHRGWGRGRALALIFLLAALVLAAVIIASVPPLLAQLQHIIEDAPNERRKLVAFLNQYRWAAPFVKTIRAVPLDDLVVKAGNSLIGYSSAILEIIGYAVTTLFLALYLLADPGRAKSLVYALVPRNYHVKLARILIELKTIVGGYMRGQLITSVAITVFTFGLLTILRVEDALALALFAGLTDVIPFIGGYVASAPAIIAVAPQGTATMLIVAALMFLYQEFESRILVPRVYGRTLRMSPAIVLLALLVGGTLLGILGALLALPIAAGLKMVVSELRVELPGEEHLDAEVRARDEKAEQVYEELAAGEPVEKAAAIAGELAARIKQSEQHGGRVSAELEAIREVRAEEEPAVANDAAHKLEKKQR